jgi:hypothetical protein
VKSLWAVRNRSALPLRWQLRVTYNFVVRVRGLRRGVVVCGADCLHGCVRVQEAQAVDGAVGRLRGPPKTAELPVLLEASLTQTLLTAAVVPRESGATRRLGERILCDVHVASAAAAAAAAAPLDLVYTVHADGEMWLAAGAVTRRCRLPVRPGGGGGRTVNGEESAA